MTSPTLHIAAEVKTMLVHAGQSNLSSIVPQMPLANAEQKRLADMPYRRKGKKYYRKGKGYTRAQIIAIHFAKLRRKKRRKR